jgi:hypothetical protein
MADTPNYSENVAESRKNTDLDETIPYGDQQICQPAEISETIEHSNIVTDDKVRKSRSGRVIKNNKKYDC